MRRGGLGPVDKVANLLLGKNAAVILCQQGEIRRLFLQRPSDRTIANASHPMALRAIAAKVKLRTGHYAARPHGGLRICLSLSKPNERTAQHQNGRQNPEATMYKRHLTSLRRKISERQRLTLINRGVNLRLQDAGGRKIRQAAPSWLRTPATIKPRDRLQPSAAWLAAHRLYPLEYQKVEQDKEKLALSIIDRLRAAGFAAYLAGGCVRDRILGLKAKDYDIATDARPDSVARLFDNTAAVGAKFGVMLVMLGGEQFEVATFRAEADYTDGRRPSTIRFGSLEEDVKRRDFTIGGMYLDPATGQIIDLVGGMRDLRAGVIR